ncbi:MAG: hypothetical protein U0169_11945 [Polyangiaceae bacterium]
MTRRTPPPSRSALSLRSRLVLVAAVALVPFAARPAFAVGTRAFDLDTQEELSGGDLTGVSVGSDGVVRAGFTLGSLALDGVSSVFGATDLADGSVLVATGATGRIVQVREGRASTFAETGELAVTSIVQGPDGTVYAATIPNGKIFRIRDGKSEPFATLPETDHVWALALDPKGAGFYAATGPHGKLFRVGFDKQVNVFWSSEEPNLVSLAVEADGSVLVGSSGKALLARVSGPGRATVVHDFPGDDVKAIAVAKDKVYVVTNEYSEPPEPPKRGGGAKTAGPQTSPRAKPGKGSLWRVDERGVVERLMKHDEFHYVSLALDDAGEPYVGTGAEGRVYTANDAHAVTLVADTDERQIAAIAFPRGKSSGHVVGGDSANFHKLLGRGGAAAVWTSKVQDCGMRARFGKLAFRASGPLEFSTRSGNTQAPDTTWSAWSAPMRAEGAIASPAGRFLQVRARWTSDANVALSEVILPFVTDNARPVVLDVNAVPKSAPKDSKDALPASGGEPGKHDASVKISWKVDNVDNDTLRYRLAFARVGQATWRSILPESEILAKTEYEWDTSVLSEGKYKVRVEASDEGVNGPSDARRHALESAPFLVDNTPPTFNELELRGRTLVARVSDGASNITRVDVAIDGRLEWRPVPAKDGVFDDRSESIEADLRAIVPAGSHLVAVRAFDALGNATVREVESR